MGNIIARAKISDKLFEAAGAFVGHRRGGLGDPGAEVISQAEGCPIAGFRIANHVMTTQHHPEMQADFLAAILDLLEDENIPALDSEILMRARASSQEPVHSQVVMGWIARFLSRGHDRTN